MNSKFAIFLILYPSEVQLISGPNFDSGVGLGGEATAFENFVPNCAHE